VGAALAEAAEAQAAEEEAEVDEALPTHRPLHRPPMSLRIPTP
jgi:hypothetical protein